MPLGTRHSSVRLFHFCIRVSGGLWPPRWAPVLPWFLVGRCLSVPCLREPCLWRSLGSLAAAVVSAVAVVAGLRAGPALMGTGSVRPGEGVTCPAPDEGGSRAGFSVLGALQGVPRSRGCSCWEGSPCGPWGPGTSSQPPLGGLEHLPGRETETLRPCQFRDLLLPFLS